MEIVVQHVVVEWTKRSRGGAGATRRNAVPLGYPLPGAVLTGGLHHVSHDEHDDFAPRPEAEFWPTREQGSTRESGPVCRSQPVRGSGSAVGSWAMRDSGAWPRLGGSRTARFHPRAHGELRESAVWVDHEIRVHPDGAAVIVELRPDRYGTPSRDFGPAPVTVTPGTSLAWHLNRRYLAPYDGHWRYRLDTYRVAVAPVAPDAFLAPATRVVDERAHLF